MSDPGYDIKLYLTYRGHIGPPRSMYVLRKTEMPEKNVMRRSRDHDYIPS